MLLARCSVEVFMPDNGKSRPIRFAGSDVGEDRHICAFFDSAEDEYRVLLPFIAEGLQRGEKAFHVVAPSLVEDHIGRLQRAGIDVAGTRATGQFKLCDWDKAYFPDGRFDMQRMVDMWRGELASTKGEGFPSTRLVAHMEWSLEKRDGVSDILEYEARFNEVPHREHVVICTYDVRKYPGDFIIDVMRTHPLVIIGGILHKNPFYVPPHEFVRALRARSS